MRNTQIEKLILTGNYMNKLDVVIRENLKTGFNLISISAAYHEEINSTIINIEMKRGEQNET